MKYTLIYTQRAERDIVGLDSKTKEGIGKTLLRYKEEPLRYAEKLSDPILGKTFWGGCLLFDYFTFLT